MARSSSSFYAFGGSSGLMWADTFLPAARVEPTLFVYEQRSWWVTAAVLGAAYIVVLGRGIQLPH